MMADFVTNLQWRRTPEAWRVISNPQYAAVLQAGYGPVVYFFGIRSGDTAWPILTLV
jgi:hypothetical protein